MANKYGIVIGDVHRGLVYKGIDFDTRIEGCLQQVRSEIVKEQEAGKEYEFIVFLGDLFHSGNPSIDLLVRVILDLSEWDSLEVPITIIRGNHDYKNKEGEHEPFDLLEQLGFRNISFVSKKVIVQTSRVEAGADMIFWPHFLETDRDMDIEKGLRDGIFKFKNRDKIKNIFAFTHHSFDGAFAGSEQRMQFGKDLKIPKILTDSKEVDKIFCGHIHTPQVQGKIECPGSIETLRFGEGFERCYIEVEF